MSLFPLPRGDRGIVPMTEAMNLGGARQVAAATGAPVGAGGPAGKKPRRAPTPAEQELAARRRETTAWAKKAISEDYLAVRAATATWLYNTPAGKEAARAHEKWQAEFDFATTATSQQVLDRSADIAAVLTRIVVYLEALANNRLVTTNATTGEKTIMAPIDFARPGAGHRSWTTDALKAVHAAESVRVKPLHDYLETFVSRGEAPARETLIQYLKTQEPSLEPFDDGTKDWNAVLKAKNALEVDIAQYTQERAEQTKATEQFQKATQERQQALLTKEKETAETNIKTWRDEALWAHA